MKTYTDTILTVDQPNKNGRIYPKEVVQRMVDTAKRLEGYMLGEICPYHDSHVNVENASHILENLELQADGTLKGTVRVLNTPKGDVLRTILDAGIRVDLRPRGLGTVNADGTVTDYQLISIDVVVGGA